MVTVIAVEAGRCVACEVRAEAEEIVIVTVYCLSCELRVKEIRVPDIRAT